MAQAPVPRLPGEPEFRTAPPWLIDEMVAAQPELAARMLAEPPPPGIVAALRGAAERGEPITTVGCGTSEHGAMAVAALLDEAFRALGVTSTRPAPRQAFEAALDPVPAGVCIGISHEGATRATTDALRAARSAGAVTALVTAAPDGPAASHADHVLVTPLRDRSWCHTVGYLSPILGGAAMAGALSSAPLDPPAAAALVASVLDRVARASDRLASHVGGARRFITVGSGVDHVAARELALKVEEGARLPARALDVETVLHGHLAATDRETGLLVISTERMTDASALGPRTLRTLDLLRAARELGMPTVLLAPASAGGSLSALVPDRGLVTVLLPDPPDGVSPVLASLLLGAAALQAVALGVIRRTGVNPDLIGRERPEHRSAAALAEASPDQVPGTMPA